MDDKIFKKSIIAIDLKSFFAMCECLERGVDPYKTPLIVTSSNKGSMSLAISPYLKAKGIASRTRLYNLPKDLKYIRAEPRLGLYTRKSKEVLEVYRKFVADEDLHVYSIDEVFIDITHYLSLYKKSPYEIAKIILKEVEKSTGLIASAGIGPNVFLAKVAMDLDAKNSKEGTALWDLSSIEDKLWKISPLSKIWGIGKNMERNLNSLNIYSVRDLALYDKNVLKDKFGVIGADLHNKVNGFDSTTIKELNEPPKSKSISHSQMLYKDYNENNILLTIKETIDMLTRRLRLEKKKCHSISLFIVYSKDVGGGFSKRVKLDKLTNDSKEIYKVCFSIFDNFYDYKPIRQVGISLGELQDDVGEQLSLFKSYTEVKKEDDVNKAIDFIKDKYGENILLSASSLLDDSTIISRNNKNS